jgi:hypothetical protein
MYLVDINLIILLIPVLLKNKKIIVLKY